jgi:hypothetical protein
MLMTLTQGRPALKIFEQAGPQPTRLYACALWLTDPDAQHVPSGADAGETAPARHHIIKTCHDWHRCGVYGRCGC